MIKLAKVYVHVYVDKETEQPKHVETKHTKDLETECTNPIANLQVDCTISTNLSGNAGMYV